MPLIKLKDDIVCYCNAETAIKFIKDLDNLKRYEPHVVQFNTEPNSPIHGTYQTHKCFAGISWQREFSYKKTKYGFTIQMHNRPYGIRMQGGFTVYAISPNTCEISHYGEYDFPRIFALITSFIAPFLKRGITKELKQIKILINEKAVAKKSPDAHVLPQPSPTVSH